MADLRITADDIATLLEWHAQLSYDSRRSGDEPLVRKLEAIRENLTRHEIVGTWESPTLGLLTIFCSCGWRGEGDRYKAHIEEQKS